MRRSLFALSLVVAVGGCTLIPGLKKSGDLDTAKFESEKSESEPETSEASNPSPARKAEMAGRCQGGAEHEGNGMAEMVKTSAKRDGWLSNGLKEGTIGLLASASCVRDAQKEYKALRTQFLAAVPDISADEYES